MCSSVASCCSLMQKWERERGPGGIEEVEDSRSWKDFEKRELTCLSGSVGVGAIHWGPGIKLMPGRRNPYG